MKGLFIKPLRGKDFGNKRQNYLLPCHKPGPELLQPRWVGKPYFSFGKIFAYKCARIGWEEREEGWVSGWRQMRAESKVQVSKKCEETNWSCEWQNNRVRTKRKVGVNELQEVMTGRCTRCRSHRNKSVLLTQWLCLNFRLWNHPLLTKHSSI